MILGRLLFLAWWLTSRRNRALHRLMVNMRGGQ